MRDIHKKSKKPSLRQITIHMTLVMLFVTLEILINSLLS